MTQTAENKDICTKVFTKCSKSYFEAAHICKCAIVALIFSVLSNSIITYFENKLYLTDAHSRGEARTFWNYSVSSSVWCNIDGHDNGRRTCLFNNLCWLPSEEQFIFLLGEESTLSGVADWRDLSSLDFSSVDGHNKFLMKITVIDVPITAQHPLSHFVIHKEREWVYLMWRFKPDNIMHIVHDDLIPLFYTYEEICGGDIQSCAEKYNLIFVDEVTDEFAEDLYKIFSSNKMKNGFINGGKPEFIRTKWRNYPNSSICFSHARMGLRSTGSWFQYGFGKPQGAIESPNLSIAALKKFSKFVQHGMNIPDSKRAGNSHQNDDLPPRALYLSRSINRRILNEVEFINATKMVYSAVMETKSPLQLDFFNPAPNSSSSGVKEMLQIISRQPLPRLILGMHGAALTVAVIFCLGLNHKPNSMAFMELFPMGINPTAVSPVSVLMKAISMENSNQAFYESWANVNPSKSFLPSVNGDPLLGGGDLCQGLDLTVILPPVQCCHNREYLCRMFQDTLVDVEKTYPSKLRALLQQQKMYEGQNESNYNIFRWFFPAPVHNIQCLWNITKGSESLLLSWSQPVNLFVHPHYYVAVVTLTRDEASKEKLIVSQDNDLKHKTREVHFKDFSLKVGNPVATVVIPQEFIKINNYELKALIWVQTVVLLKHREFSKHRTSLDTYYECSLPV